MEDRVKQVLPEAINSSNIIIRQIKLEEMFQKQTAVVANLDQVDLTLELKEMIQILMTELFLKMKAAAKVRQQFLNLIHKEEEVDLLILKIPVKHLHQSKERKMMANTISSHQGLNMRNKKTKSKLKTSFRVTISKKLKLLRMILSSTFKIVDGDRFT